MLRNEDQPDHGAIDASFQLQRLPPEDDAHTRVDFEDVPLEPLSSNQSSAPAADLSPHGNGLSDTLNTSLLDAGN